MKYFLCLLFTLSFPTLTAELLHWDYINVDIKIQKNGDLFIVEEFKYVFSDTQSNSSYRYRWWPSGMLDTIDRIQLIKDEQQIAFEIKKLRKKFYVSWNHPVKPSEVQIFTLKYRVRGHTHTTGSQAKIYWKAIFKNKKVLVKKAKITIHFPFDISKTNSTAKIYGASDIKKSQKDEKTIEFYAESIPHDEGIIVDVRLPWQKENYVPSWQKQKQQRPKKNKYSPIIIFLVCVIVIICILNIASKKGIGNFGGGAGYGGGYGGGCGGGGCGGGGGGGGCGGGG